jgi:outer membrane protein assembly factor BamB
MPRHEPPTRWNHWHAQGKANVRGSVGRENLVPLGPQVERRPVLSRIIGLHLAPYVTCIEAATGQMVWTERVGGKFAASPIYADGRLYFLDQKGFSG